MAYAPATASYYLDVNHEPTSAFEEQASLLEQQALLHSTLTEFRSIPAPAMMAAYSPPPHHFDAFNPASMTASASLLQHRPIPIRASSWHTTQVPYTPVEIEDTHTSPPWPQMALPRSVPTDMSYLASPDPTYRFPPSVPQAFENVAVDFPPLPVSGWETTNGLGAVFDYDAQSMTHQQLGSGNLYSGDFVPRYSLPAGETSHSPYHSPDSMVSPEPPMTVRSPELSQYLAAATTYSIQSLSNQPSPPASAPAYPQPLPITAGRPKASSLGPADSKSKGRVETFSIWEGADPSEMPKRTYPSRGSPSSSETGKVRSSASVSGLGLALGSQVVVEEHDPERKFACDLCHKAFKRRGTYNQHRRTHTGERPHLCPLYGCRKAFQTTSNLKRHIGTHKKADIRLLKVSKAGY